MTTTNKRRYLVLFTNNYPYGHGEYFLENEIPEIAPPFERVVIIANSPDSTQTRQLPENCVAFNCPITKNRWLRLKCLVTEFCSLLKISYTDRSSFFHTKPKWLLPRLKSLLTIILFGEEKLLASRQILKDYPISETIIYSYWMDHNGYVVSRLKNCHRDYRAICRAHGCDLYTERTNCDYLPLRSFITNNLDHSIFISQHGLNYLQGKLPTLQNGLVSRLGTKRQTAIISSFNLEPPFHLLSVSNLIPLKQVHLIIEALAKCETRWQWTHFGDGPERHKLEQLAQEKNIVSRFMGAVENKNILEYYTKNPVDCFINVSATEGLPVSIMEALSFGVPVIAPAINGIPEIVNSNVGHLLSSQPTIEEIAKALDEIAKQTRSEKEKMRINARDFWEKEYCAKAVFNKFNNILKNM